jgi:Flp pilus assembly protein TadG
MASGAVRLIGAIVRRLVGNRRGAVAPIVAILAPTLILLGLGTTDAAIGLDTKNDLQNATDAAALAVAHAVLANANTTEASLQATAQAVLNSDFRGPAPTIVAFHVCAPVQNDCKMGATTLPSDTVTLQASAQALCTLCLSGGTSKTVYGTSQTVIGFSKTMQINIVMDSSASMIVGSTTADVTTISNWVSSHWNSVKVGDPGPCYNGGSGSCGSSDNPPCAFACHDEGGSTTAADIATGLTNAHSAGATTRFDVMTSAASQLITYVAGLASSNTLLAKNTYVFNVYSFDTALHTYGTSNMTSTKAQTAVTSVTPGLDTWLSQDMTSLISTVGSSGTGASAASPLKFVILVTDGLQSDRNNNWACTSSGYDSAWNFSPTCYGGYDGPISTTQCQSIKNNGVVLAVLETPYVPLTGQSPNVQPYEKTVRHTIYPSGPGGTSAISTALQACASTGYYFQATNSSQISTGFLQLTNQFLQHSTYIAQ